MSSLITGGRNLYTVIMSLWFDHYLHWNIHDVVKKEQHSDLPFSQTSQATPVSRNTRPTLKGFYILSKQQLYETCDTLYLCLEIWNNIFCCPLLSDVLIWLMIQATSTGTTEFWAKRGWNHLKYSVPTQLASLHSWHHLIGQIYCDSSRKQDIYV